MTLVLFANSQLACFTQSFRALNCALTPNPQGKMSHLVLILWLLAIVGHRASSLIGLQSQRSIVQRVYGRRLLTPVLSSLVATSHSRSSHEATDSSLANSATLHAQTPDSFVPISQQNRRINGSALQRNLVIIGSGPAGSTAALYAARAMLAPLQVGGSQFGGQLMLTTEVENFPGYTSGVTGPQLVEDISAQAQHFGNELWHTDVLRVNLSTRPFLIELENCTIASKAVIIATGANAKWLNAKREEEFRGKGVSTCATCDGFLFRRRDVLVIGGGDSAMEEAIFLSKMANKVTLVHRSTHFRASAIMIERAKKIHNIEFITDTEVIEWEGTHGRLAGARVQNKRTGLEYSLPCDGAFVAIGHSPNTAFLDNQIETDSDGYIVLNKFMMTSVHGVFACGDVVDRRYRQAITAAGMGCQAALEAERFLAEET